jgi:D-arabinose 5-phosphate isomerase GutQ
MASQSKRPSPVRGSSRPDKRRRVSNSTNGDDVADPVTPPPSDSDSLTEQSSAQSEQPTMKSALSLDDVLARATHILATEALALSNITNLYQTSPTAQTGLKNAVSAILTANKSYNKLVVCGVGKSAYIAQKLVATCKSLGLPSSFLHACEAIHGDLGDIRRGDVLLFVSFSGKTPELLNLLPHISAETRILALTGQERKEDCTLLYGREDGVLLPAPIPEKEEASFGVAAPTTSTTVALAVADMLALTVAHELHHGKTKEVFRTNHPGGAIGMNHREVEKLKKDGEDFTVLELPSPSITASDDG